MDDEGNILPRGPVGEIVHRGANTMLGYYKDEAATAAAQLFGWHHTGDLGMFDEGDQLLFLDRKKDMIKTGGENVPSIKVESAILAHPAIAGVAVIGAPTVSDRCESVRASNCCARMAAPNSCPCLVIHAQIEHLLCVGELKQTKARFGAIANLGQMHS